MNYCMNKTTTKEDLILYAFNETDLKDSDRVQRGIDGDPLILQDFNEIVETMNILEKSAYNGASDHLRITERFRPVSRDAIEWSATFDDASTWVRPWTFGMRLSRDDSHPLVEYACHEGNEGLRGILAAARAEEQAAKSKR